jgi:transposase
MVRVDATTVSGYHEGGEDSLFQFGHSKDDPSLRQIKLMTGDCIRILKLKIMGFY